MDFDEPIRNEDVIEGRRFPLSPRENANAVLYRLARMRQRGVLIAARDMESQVRADAMAERVLAQMGIKGAFGGVPDIPTYQTTGN